MSILSSENGSGMASHYATSPSLESTGTSVLFSLLSNSSDVQTDVTPPTSPTSSEGKMRTPRDILDASRRLGQISALALNGDSDVMPTKLLKQFHLRSASQSVANDEAGYDADGDGDGDEKAHGGAGTTATTRPIRRPAFLRIDTRQHRRVASMLATTRPTSPGPHFRDANVLRPPRVKLSSISLLKPTTTTTAGDAVESYELRLRPKAEPVGLGIGFPEGHPLRCRAFTMPIPHSVSPISDSDGSEGEQRFEWLPTGFQARLKKKRTQVDVHAPNPVRLVLRPTFLEVSPSPIERLPAPAGVWSTHDLSEMERERYRALAREGRPRLYLP